MAVKSGPQWSQNATPTPPRTVYTSKNTSFEEWKAMLHQYKVDYDIVEMKLHPLAELHAWESDKTPISYADELLERKRKAATRDTSNM